MRNMAMTRDAARRATATIGLLGVLVAVGACGSDEPSTDSAPGLDDLPSPSESTSDSADPEPVDDMVSRFRDTFDDDRNGWELPPNESGTTEVRDGDFVWDFKKPQLAPHLIAHTLGTAYDEGRLDMGDVHVSASVTPLRGLAAPAVFCREVPDTDSDFQWYEFVVRDGYAAIRRADIAQNLEVLAEVDDVALPLGEKATIKASCVNGDNGEAQLTLELNGEQLLQADVADPLDNGVPGLQAYDVPAEASDEPMVIVWHDFAVDPAG